MSETNAKQPETVGAQPAPHHPDPHGAQTGHGHGKFLTLALGSVGVVYGDIGTSPLYAFREALHHTSSDGLTRSEVTGVVSLLLWALTIVVTLKYVLFVMQADNRGEGGTLSLVALARGAIGKRSGFVFVIGVLGASMFFGDAVITPAISVLSAVEGLKLVTPAFDQAVVPITIVILIVLFAFQSFGTGGSPRCSARSRPSGSCAWPSPARPTCRTTPRSCTP